jgi:hypothetical protein
MRVKVRITPPEPVPGLDDFTITLNPLEMGAISSVVYDFVRTHPDRRYLFERVMKQIDEFYVRDKFGDKYYEKYDKEHSGV